MGERSIGLFGATGIGVGAIVGGGVLALAGTAFAVTGPSAVLAFAANGLIALLTALAFAELATAFPESGGTYTFAKKVLSVEAAFLVGWVVWFASIVAAALYALGFGTFAAIFLEQLWTSFAGTPPAALRSHALELVLALAATAFYLVRLTRRGGGGGQWETIGKVVVFMVLIAGGLWAVASTPASEATSRLRPFFAQGGLGLVQAMGYTFIALQGFDLIAAVGGEVKAPRRNLPRAMVGSLVVALLIYIPLLLVIATVGVPEGGSIQVESQADPEAVVVTAVERFLGAPGLWLILVAAVLSMLSALQANLLAASHIAATMAADHNLPSRLRELDPRRGTPVWAILATSGLVVVLTILLPDIAVAGAASSLIFLVSFALAHWTSILARRRGGAPRRTDGETPFRLPFFPLIPTIGGAACLGLAIFQGLAVPSAGLLGGAWLALGGVLYVRFFSRRARVADAATEAYDPDLVRLRGRSPLVLVPIANPASVETLVTLASNLAPPQTGRVLLLYVVQKPTAWHPGAPPPQLLYAQEVLGQALGASLAADLAPETLTTIAQHPWQEIARVADAYNCESMLLGLGSFEQANEGQDVAHGEDLQELLAEVDSDVVLSRIPPSWSLSNARRVLVPVGGRRDQSALRARLLGSLCRSWGGLEVVFLGIVQPTEDARAMAELEDEMHTMAEDEAPGRSRVLILRRDDVADAIVEHAAQADLVILGTRRRSTKPGDPGMFGKIPVRVANQTDSALLLISRK